MGTSLSDSQVERAVEGDEAALEALLREVTIDGSIRVDIASSWRRSLDEDDIVQVSSMEAFLRIGSLRTPTVAGFRAWFQRIVDNNARDAIRGLERDKRPHPADRVTHGAEGASARTLLAAMTGVRGADGPAILEEELMRLRAAIANLPASYRVVVERLDLAEDEVATVADALDRSQGAVHMLRSRAHDRLRELLRKSP